MPDRATDSPPIFKKLRREIIDLAPFKAFIPCSPWSAAEETPSGTIDRAASLLSSFEELPIPSA
jgi:hypothetical protein